MVTIVSGFVVDRVSRRHHRRPEGPRLANRVQLTTDGHSAYLEAVEDAFGDDVDLARLVKAYTGPAAKVQARYSPGKIVAAKPTRITGSPDPGHISTSVVERLNLTVKMIDRHSVENALCRFKDFRRVATRYHKLAANFLSGVALATALAFWL